MELVETQAVEETKVRKIVCSAGKGVMAVSECLDCALARKSACGLDYVTLKALFKNAEHRPGIHVTDVLGCPLRAFWSKTDPVPEYPHKMLARTIGTAWHEYVEDSDEHVTCELPVAWDDLVGTSDIVYADGRLVDTKCQPAGELVTMADGTEKPIEEVKIFDQILAWSNDGPVPARITAIMDGGLQDVYEIHIASGQVIRVSENHPILTDRGWVPAREIIPTQDRVIQLTDWTGSNEMALEDARLLGYLTGDGGTSRQYGISFSNIDHAILDDMQEICRSKGWDLVKVPGDNCDWRITNQGKKLSTTGPMAFIDEHELHGKRAHEKTVPVKIMTGNLSVIANFLAGLFDTDGMITDPTSTVPSRLDISTTSKKLALQVSELLRRLGIANRIHSEVPTLNGTRMRTSYRVCVWQFDMILKFSEIIPFRSIHKCQRIEGWKPILSEKIRKGGKNLRRVEKVILLGPMQTIGLEVEEYHTYITSGVITHNTTRWLVPSKLPYGSHELQVNVYALMLKKMGREINSLAIQYIDVSGPSKCREHSTLMEMIDGVVQCPICGYHTASSHLGAMIVEVPIMSEPEIMAKIGDGWANLRAALSMGIAPPPEPSYACSYCDFQDRCPAKNSIA